MLTLFVLLASAFAINDAADHLREKRQSISACASGQVPILSNGREISCTPGRVGECPGDATCNFDTLTRSSRCCGRAATTTLAFDGCQVGYKLARDGMGQRISCGLTFAAGSTCPSDAICMLNAMTNTYQCCTAESGCPSGTVPVLRSGVRVSCSGTFDQTSCPSFGTCAYNSLANAYQCCQRDVGQCPSGQTAFMDSSGSPRTCILNSPFQTCPSTHQCQTSTSSQAICCAPEGRCPNNQSPIRDATGRMVTCSFLGSTSCPTGASCVSAIGAPTPTYVCCTSSSTQQFCPINSQPLMISGVPSRCNPGICSPGYSCMPMMGSTLSYCCTDQSSRSTCPSGMSQSLENGGMCINGALCSAGFSCVQAVDPISRVTNGQRVCCQPDQSSRSTCPSGMSQSPENGGMCFNGGFCGAGFSCVQAVDPISRVPNGQRVCCQDQTNTRCPPGMSSSTGSSGTAQFCTGGVVNICSPPYSCVMGVDNQNRPANAYVCCLDPATTTQCPNNQPALTNFAGLPETCTAVGQPCSQSGYLCQRSKTGDRFLCCSQQGSADSVCPTGKQPYRTSLDNQMVYCRSSSQCPSSYDCSYSQYLRDFVCCGTDSILSACPLPGQTPIYQSATQPLTCFSDSQCQRVGYTCQFVPARGQSICCGPNSGSQPGQCPQVGQQPQLNMFTNQPVTCMFDSQCSTGYTCIYSSSLRQNLCCSSISPSANPCPNMGQEALYAPNSAFPTTCTTNSQCLTSTSSTSFTCQFSTTMRQNICCGTRGSPSGVCPIANQEAIYMPGSNQPVTCSSDVQCNGARPGFSCQFSNVVRQSICCGSTASLNNVCPMVNMMNQEPIYAPGSTVPVTCTSDIQCNGARLGFTCQFSSSLRQSICCGASFSSGMQCANGQPVQPAPADGPQMCASGCATGYECGLSTTGLRVCCRSASLENRVIRCANDQLALPSPSSCTMNGNNWPSSGGNNCPTNYLCAITSNKSPRCCLGGGTFEMTCDSNGSPLKDNFGQTIICDLTTAPTGISRWCPTRYSCYSSARGSTDTLGVCCPERISTMSCSVGRPLMSAVGQIVTCNPNNLMSCPSGSFCLTAANVPSTFICCTGLFDGGANFTTATTTTRPRFG